jgi:hypothetical protein
MQSGAVFAKKKRVGPFSFMGIFQLQYSSVHQSKDPHIWFRVQRKNVIPVAVKIPPSYVCLCHPCLKAKTAPALFLTKHLSTVILHELVLVVQLVFVRSLHSNWSQICSFLNGYGQAALSLCYTPLFSSVYVPL